MNANLNVQKTPLYEQHMIHGAVIEPFMGCLLPLHYGDAVAEHRAVRTQVGLFDAAHRTEILLTGADAKANLQHLLCTNIAGLEVGQVRRSLMLNMQGGVMDDVQLYRMQENTYRLAIHTMNRNKDLRHIQRQKFGDVKVVEPESECRLSLDGPNAQLLLACLEADLPENGDFAMTRIGGVPCRLSRIGFAGEDGFSICCEAENSVDLFNAIVEAGEPFGLRLCGTKSFDTLRLEAGHSRYGLDIDDAVNPMETGFRRLVHMGKRDFVGRDAIIAGGEPRRARIGLKLEEDVAQPGMSVVHRDKEVGAVTSGAYCPYVGASLALALVETPYSEEGRHLRVEIGEKLVCAQVVALPFYAIER